MTQKVNARKDKTNWRSRIIGSGMMRPKEIEVNPLNWRLHDEVQRSALRDVIERVGIVDRIIVNKTTGRLVDGHLRVELAIESGETEVAVDFVELSEEEERLVLATFDSITGMAVTDRTRFLEVLEGIGKDAKNDLANMLQTLTDRMIGLEIEPPNFQEKKEGIGDEVEYIECPKCNHRWPK